jgi:hypothetical protein
VEDFGCKVQGSGFGVQSSGFRVQDSGSRVQGSGFRVRGSCLGVLVLGWGFGFANLGPLGTTPC